MLILTRKADESIIINDNIEVTVISVKGNQVRIGIAAPSDVSIQRKEIQQRILDEGETPDSSENPS